VCPFLSQAELNSVVSVLEEHALDTITVDHTQGSRGQELTTLTLVCKADDGDQVAAALLQVRLAVPHGLRFAAYIMQVLPPAVQWPFCPAGLRGFIPSYHSNRMLETPTGC
jgi:hypothetical protein